MLITKSTFKIDIQIFYMYFGISKYFHTHKCGSLEKSTAFQIYSAEASDFLKIVKGLVNFNLNYNL